MFSPFARIYNFFALPPLPTDATSSPPDAVTSAQTSSQIWLDFFTTLPFLMRGLCAYYGISILEIENSAVRKLAMISLAFIPLRLLKLGRYLSGAPVSERGRSALHVLRDGDRGL